MPNDLDNNNNNNKDEVETSGPGASFYSAYLASNKQKIGSLYKAVNCDYPPAVEELTRLADSEDKICSYSLTLAKYHLRKAQQYFAMSHTKFKKHSEVQFYFAKSLLLEKEITGNKEIKDIKDIQQPVDLLISFVGNGLINKDLLNEAVRLLDNLKLPQLLSGNLDYDSYLTNLTPREKVGAYTFILGLHFFSITNYINAEKYLTIAIKQFDHNEARFFLAKILISKQGVGEYKPEFLLLNFCKFTAKKELFQESIQIIEALNIKASTRHVIIACVYCLSRKFLNFEKAREEVEKALFAPKLSKEDLELIVEVFDKINCIVTLSGNFLLKIMAILTKDEKLRGKFNFEQNYNRFIQSESIQINKFILDFPEFRSILLQQKDPTLVINLLNRTTALIEPPGKLAVIIENFIHAFGKPILQWLSPHIDIINTMITEKNIISGLQNNDAWKKFIISHRGVLISNTPPKYKWLDFSFLISYGTIISPYLQTAVDEYNSLKSRLLKGIENAIQRNKDNPSLEDTTPTLEEYVKKIEKAQFKFILEEYAKELLVLDKNLFSDLNESYSMVIELN